MTFVLGARVRRLVLLTALFAALLVLYAWLDRRLVSAALFLRFEGGAGAPEWLVHYGEHPVVERVWRLPTGERGRLYVPRDPAPAGVLLVHGMHEDGVDEERLVNFARAIASTGAVVGTPELSGLKRFKLAHSDVVNVAEAAALLAEEIAQPKVTVFGVSFGGGLALRAACDPTLAKAIGRVIALGAPHDLSRVGKFVLGAAPSGPGGETARIEVHPYARKALRRFLFDEPTPPEDDAAIARALDERAAELHALSPASCATPIEADVHLVHGVGDRVIPFTETLWLARALPARETPEVLISPVISHAAYAPPTLRQRLELVEFMAKAVDW